MLKTPYIMLAGIFLLPCNSPIQNDSSTATVDAQTQKILVRSADRESLNNPLRLIIQAVPKG